MSPPFPLPGVRAEDRSSQRQEKHKGEQLQPGKKRNLDALLMMQKRKKNKLVDSVRLDRRVVERKKERERERERERV